MSFWSRQSLTVKMPIMIALLLLTAMGAIVIASYYEMRKSVLAMAGDRLNYAAGQIGTVLTTATRQRKAQLLRLLESPEVRQFLTAPDDGPRNLVLDQIDAYLGAAAGTASIEMFDVSGRRVIHGGRDVPEYPQARLQPLFATYRSERGAVHGRMWFEGSTLANPVGGAVRDGETVIGYLVERRGGANVAQTGALLRNLIGAEASILLGNDDGSAWTDLGAAVQGPPRELHGAGGLVSYVRDGRPAAFARITPIAGTPWVIAIEFPVGLVMAPVQHLLQRAVAIGLLLVAAAAAAGWFSSRLITTPLVQVTEAAEAVAESRPAVHFDFKREDELGRLADSFNTMAERVAQARHELERRVDQRTSELQSANQELEAFSYSVSHDLRAPLRAIAGFVQILDEDHRGKLDSHGQHSLDRVKINARRMGQLIDDLLAFSHIGRAPLLRNHVDVIAIARRVAGEQIAAALPRRIDVIIDPLPACMGEPALITQVFVNLISNAVKFTARCDRPSIRIGADERDGETVYFVRDNGAGFDSRYAEKLFGVFQRLHKADDFEGTGVGLAIVQRVVNRHGGRVWAEGKPNAGATFYFTLPPAASSVATQGVA